MPPKKDDDMTEAERRVAEHVAQTVVARLLDAVQDEETVDRIVDKWSGAVDKTIGRGLRRFAWYVFLGLLGLASVKLGMIEKLTALLKP